MGNKNRFFRTGIFKKGHKKIVCTAAVFMLTAACAFSQGVIPQQNRVLSKQWVSNAMQHFNKGDLKKSTECLEKAMMYDPENEDAQTLMYEVMNLALRQVKERESSVKTNESKPVTSQASGYDFAEYDEPASLEFTNQLSGPSSADPSYRSASGSGQTDNHQYSRAEASNRAFQNNASYAQDPSGRNASPAVSPAVTAQTSQPKQEKKKGFFGSLFSGGLFSRKSKKQPARTAQTAPSADRGAVVQGNLKRTAQSNPVPDDLMARRAAQQQQAYSSESNSRTDNQSGKKSSLMSLFASGSLVNSRRSPMVSSMMSRAVQYKPQYRLVSSYLQTTPDTLGNSLASGYEKNYRSSTSSSKKGVMAQTASKASTKEKSYRPENEMDRVRVNELNEMGLEYANKSQFKKAIPLFEKALALEPGNLVALNNLALAYAYNDDLYSAIKTYRKIMTLTSPGSEYNKLARSMIKKLKQII
jgi:Tfp pilus assembly protein PilF